MALGSAIVVVSHHAALAQQAVTQTSSGGSGGPFDLWKEVGSRLRQFGPAGFLVLGLLAFVGWVVSQAGNLEKVIGWFRGREQPKPAPDPFPRQSATAADGDQAVVANVSDKGNVVAVGQDNQLLSGVSAGRDVVLGVKVEGDQAAGDKFSGDKVLGDKNVYLPAPQRPSLPEDQTLNNLPALGATADYGFVGRKEQLQKLSELMDSPGARVFLTGMGGVGKSELALQYAYTAVERYSGGILRLDARQGFDGMALEVISFVRTSFPGLIPKEGEAKDLLPQCWNCWPSADKPPEPVLLIFDDLIAHAEGYAAEERLCLGLPQRFRRLITQRDVAPTGSWNINLEVLDPVPARQLLQIQIGEDGKRRVNAEPQAADDLCAEVGFLPLALVLLGARLADLPDLTLKQLLENLKAKGAAAMALQKAHPELRASRGVVESLLVSWEPLAKETKELAILLALMAPAVIPWKLVERCWGTEADQAKSSELLDAQAELLRTNLLRWEQDGLYKLHPLVRLFLRLKSQEKPDQAQHWRTQLATGVAAVTREMIPVNITLEQVVEVRPFIPHLAQIATDDSALLHDNYLVWPYIGIGRFFEGQGDFIGSLPWRLECLSQCEQRLGRDHPETATSLNNLALLYNSLGAYSKAEPLLIRALAIIEKALGPDHPDTATSLHNLAGLYYNQGAYAKAEPLHIRALGIIENALGPDHPSAAISLNSHASLQFSQGAYAKAEAICIRVLAIIERAFGSDHPTTAISLNNLAGLYRIQGAYTKAEPLLIRALTIREKALGPDHPYTSSSLNHLAVLYSSQGGYAKAEPLHIRALAIREKALGPDHPDTAQSLNNLARLYENQGAYAKAEPLFIRALAIEEKVLGPAHPSTATTLNNLAVLYLSQGAYTEAKPLLIRTLAIREKALGPDHPDTAESLNNLAVLYLSQGAYIEAEPLLIRALAIREMVLGPDHPDIAQSLNNLAGLYYKQGAYAKSEQVYVRALAIDQMVLGPEHPNTLATSKHLELSRAALGGQAT